MALAQELALRLKERLMVAPTLKGLMEVMLTLALAQMVETVLNLTLARSWPLLWLCIWLELWRWF